eukprot:9467130-Pyramimonas_sp.AAC.1
MVSNRLHQDAALRPLHNGDTDIIRAVAGDICESVFAKDHPHRLSYLRSYTAAWRAGPIAWLGILRRHQHELLAARRRLGLASELSTSAQSNIDDVLQRMLDTAMRRAQLLASGGIDELLTAEQHRAIDDEQQLLEWMVAHDTADPVATQVAPLGHYIAPEFQSYIPPPPLDADIVQSAEGQ